MASGRINVDKSSSPATGLAWYAESSFCCIAGISLPPASPALSPALPSTRKKTYPIFHLLKVQVVNKLIERNQNGKVLEKNTGRKDADFKEGFQGPWPITTSGDLVEHKASLKHKHS